MRVDVDGGKYTVVQEPDGRLHALRYGQPWRDCVGDNLIFNLAFELDAARNKPLNKEMESILFKTMCTSHSSDKTGFYMLVRAFQAYVRGDMDYMKECLEIAQREHSESRAS